VMTSEDPKAVHWARDGKPACGHKFPSKITGDVTDPAFCKPREIYMVDIKSVVDPNSLKITCVACASRWNFAVDQYYRTSPAGTLDDATGVW